jgi:hypothetical protein
MTKPAQYIPRWLTFSANIEADDTGWIFTEIPPDVFVNETLWPWHLEYLAITGLPPWGSLPIGDTAQFWGGLGSCINLELGISGVSDINQVVATAGTVMSHKKRFIKGPVTNQGRRAGYNNAMSFHRFKHPYILARGNGFQVLFNNSSDTFQYDAQSAYKGIPTFVAYGRGLTSGQPAMLAGTYMQSDRPAGTLLDPPIAGGSGISFNSADLVNDGEEDILIHEIGLAYPFDSYSVAHTVDSLGDPYLDLFALYSNYLINPINGPKWMPGSDPLPMMGVCPFDFPWPLAGVSAVIPVLQVPAVYEFPEQTRLLRRQRLSVRMSNNAKVTGSTTIPIRTNVTLFGYLEVR